MHLRQETVCAWEQLGYVQFLFFFSNDILYFCRLLKDQILWILMKETNGISLIYIYISLFRQLDVQCPVLFHMFEI